jgi:heptosyltransferase-3
LSVVSPIRRVLIYRLGSLGDTVVVLPCLHLIARQFPDAERRLLTNFPVNVKAPAAATVLGESGLVHGYMRYTAGTRSIGELLRVAWEIRRFRPDLLVYMMRPRPGASVRRDRRFFQLAGVNRIVGLPADGGATYRLDTATGLYESEAHRLGRLIRELGDVNLSDRDNWSLRLTDAERWTAREALDVLRGRQLIVCGPGTKMQAKDWGRENWRELLRRLGRRYPEHALAMVGSRDDAEMNEFAAKAWTGAKVNLCGLSPRETAAVLIDAAVFLGPDSGQMHLAASVGVPCVIAFSARGLPGVWFPAGEGHQIVYHQPECAGCGLETCIVMDRKCLRSISVDEMEQAAERVLRRRAVQA